MTLQEAINHPRVNVFDIIPDATTRLGFKIHTYKKPNEREDQYQNRNRNNFTKAYLLKTKKP